MKQGPIYFYELEASLNNAIAQGGTEQVMALLNKMSGSTIKYGSTFSGARISYDVAVFLWASLNGHPEVVKRLLASPRVDPAFNNNYAIRWASANGHSKVVKLLLADSRVNPAVWDNWPIRLASEKGHLEVVNVLLEHPAVMAYVIDNLLSFIDKCPAIENAPTKTHNDFSQKFFELISNEFMSKMPVAIAALQTFDMPNDVIFLIAKDINPLFQPYKEQVNCGKKSTEGVELINQSRNLLPTYAKNVTNFEVTAQDYGVEDYEAEQEEGYGFYSFYRTLKV